MSLTSSPLLSETVERKFIDTLLIDDYEILTDTGWEDLTHINVTIPYNEYEITLSDGKSMICADTHIFFGANKEEVFAKDCSDIKIQTIDGPISVESVIKNGKQSNMFDLTVNSDNNRYYTNDILSHNSITSIAWLLWYIIFNADKKVGILANKGAISREMLARLTLMLENLPFWLQPGCRILNKGSIKFSHNSEIIAAATSSSSIRGLALNVLMLDEFAFVNKASEFYTGVYPVITSGTDVKVIITSTPNGVGNMFYKLWEGSTQGTNEFKPFRIRWQEVPGRNEEWKRITISNTSELQFQQEFECLNFDASISVKDTITGIISNRKIGELYSIL